MKALQGINILVTVNTELRGKLVDITYIVINKICECK